MICSLSLLALPSFQQTQPFSMERARLLFLLVAMLVQHHCLVVRVATTCNISTSQSVLLALKACITHVPDNMLANNWSTTSPLCNWVGVTCSARHLRVTALDLSLMNLTGTIPPHLGNLSFLVQLIFRNNSFHCSLPTELARLCRLKFINFGYNDLEGEIPTWFGSLPKLERLYMYNKRNDSYTHFSQQSHNKLTWLVIFYYFLCFLFFSFCKKIIKYYQPRQIVVGLL
jgi:hypothetical protein